MRGKARVNYSVEHSCVVLLLPTLPVGVDLLISVGHFSHAEGFSISVTCNVPCVQ